MSTCFESRNNVARGRLGEIGTRCRRVTGCLRSRADSREGGSVRVELRHGRSPDGSLRGDGHLCLVQPQCRELRVDRAAETASPIASSSSHFTARNSTNSRPTMPEGVDLLTEVSEQTKQQVLPGRHTADDCCEFPRSDREELVGERTTIASAGRWRTTSTSGSLGSRTTHRRLMGGVSTSQGGPTRAGS